MDADWIRDLCLSFPGTTEHVQWGENLVFKVAGKIHAILILHPAAVWLSFKASPEKFFELTERPGIIPAPYLARAKWVALESRDVLTQEELASLLRESYDMVVAKLPKRSREALAGRMSTKRKQSGRKTKSARTSRKPRRKTKKPSR
ncbi:MAG: MmcQ/YjbR family DNA-binding protein [Candidatus Acidiferrum sp.]